MIYEFTSLLPSPERNECSSAFHRRNYFEYQEHAPYSKLDQAQLETCLAKVEAASLADPAVAGRAGEDRQEMISATQRWLSRDFAPGKESIASRDRSMFQTFEWWKNTIPRITR